MITTTNIKLLTQRPAEKAMPLINPQ